jgi:hypothetical protein
MGGNPSEPLPEPEPFDPSVDERGAPALPDTADNDNDPTPGGGGSGEEKAA